MPDAAAIEATDCSLDEAWTRDYYGFLIEGLDIKLELSSKGVLATTTVSSATKLLVLGFGNPNSESSRSFGITVLE